MAYCSFFCEIKNNFLIVKFGSRKSINLEYDVLFGSILSGPPGIYKSSKTIIDTEFRATYASKSELLPVSWKQIYEQWLEVQK